MNDNNPLAMLAAFCVCVVIGYGMKAIHDGMRKRAADEALEQAGVQKSVTA